MPVDTQQGITFGLGSQTVEICHRAHRLAVDTFDDIALLQGLGGRAIRVEVTDHHTLEVTRDAQLVPESRREVLDCDAP